MKVRSGFVSNSSSASFIVEVKTPTRDDMKKLCYALYDNIPCFSDDGCKDLLEKRLNFYETYKKPKDDAPDNVKRSYQREIDHIQKELDYLRNYVREEYKFSNEKLAIENNKIISIRENKHKEKVVEIAVDALHWNFSLDTINGINYTVIDAGGPIIYNDWHDVRVRKNYMELIAFLKFYNYDINIRVSGDWSL